MPAINWRSIKDSTKKRDTAQAGAISAVLVPKLIPRSLVLLFLLGRIAYAGQVGAGSFQELNSEQRQLVTKIVSRFNSSTGQSLIAQQAYDAAPISVRSTFEAVTQALLSTKLTSASGIPTGNALDLIEVIEDVAGELRGARGDQQFRIYAIMKPGAIEKLQGSTEFFRDKDNSYYHKGFPVCFRLTGLPSIQVSLTRDGKRADIDIDYRSAKFPNSLVNGHFRAANSDVRAGKNGVRHNYRWNGLSEWWKLLFGFNFGTPAKEEAGPSAFTIPPSPRITAKQPFDTAVHDFLTAWLVDDRPQLSVPYFSRRSYPCLEMLSEAQGKPFSDGTVRHEILDAMANYRKQLEPVTSLNEVVSPVELWDPAFRSYKTKNESMFTVFSVPSDLAEQNECSGGAPVAETRRTTTEKYGKYFGSAFRLHHGGLNEGTLYLLWTTQYKYWQIVNLKYIEDEDSGMSWSAKAPALVETANLRNVPGNREASQAMHDFLGSWLLKGDFKTAISFVSPTSYACFDKPMTAEKGKLAFLAGLAKVRKILGQRAELSDYLQPIIPDDPTLWLVNHPDEGAFAILSLPQSSAQSSMCNSRQKQYAVSEAVPSEQDYGRYYATSFLMKVPGKEPAALYTVWAREKDGWKMVSWQLLAP